MLSLFLCVCLSVSLYRSPYPRAADDKTRSGQKTTPHSWHVMELSFYHFDWPATKNSFNISNVFFSPSISRHQPASGSACLCDRTRPGGTSRPQGDHVPLLPPPRRGDLRDSSSSRHRNTQVSFKRWSRYGNREVEICRWCNLQIRQ